MSNNDETTTWVVTGHLRTGGGEAVVVSFFALSDDDAAQLPDGSEPTGIAITVKASGDDHVAVGLNPYEALLVANRLTRAANLVFERLELTGEAAAGQAASEAVSPTPYL